MITIFNGPPGSGKDAASSYYKTNRGFKHLSFKYQLFIETFKHFGVSEEWFMSGYENREIKETPEEILGGLSRRGALIFVSETKIKPKHGNDFFGICAANEILPGNDYCFSDGGFVDEMYPIINKVGIDDIFIIQLTRKGSDFSKDSRRYISGNLIEQFIIEKETRILKKHNIALDLPVRTYIVHNNGSIAQLHNVLDKIYEKEKNDKRDAR